MVHSDHNAAKFLLDHNDPLRIALRLIGQDCTYGELQAASCKIANRLSSTGAEKGDRVFLIGDNSLFWVAAYLGILRCGTVCVPLPTNITAEDFDYIIHATGARIGFVQARFAMLNRGRLKQTEIITDRDVATFERSAQIAQLTTENGGDHTSPAEVDADDLGALMFTSGSTGKPRGVMVSHRNIIANTESIVSYLGLTQNDRMMQVLPFHYCFGTSLLHTHLRVGASLVIDSRFMYPEKILERMQETECTGFAGVPSHFQILLRKSSLRKKQFPHLRHVQQAGGHLAPSFIRELREALPHTRVFVMYGQTEATARLAYVPPEALDSKIGSVGKPIPGVKLEVVNDSGEQVKPGEIGEVVAEGANVTQGYWCEQEETEKCFRNGKLYTGDMGTVDEDGFIYIVDRAKDFLKCGGKRISCREIEEKLLEFDELLEAAVVGEKDEILGEAVKAFVVPRQIASEGLEARVTEFCKKRFPHQLIPAVIVVMNSLPKNSAGKVLKQQLKNCAFDRHLVGLGCQ